MPQIVQAKAYNGAMKRIDRLGLTALYAELEEILTGFDLLVKEGKDSNGGAAVRDLIDIRFALAHGWIKTQTGGIDWIKSVELVDASPCLGVEIQVSSRSDLLIVDVCHLRERIELGELDVGVLVVPSDALALFLTDRGPSYSDALVAVSRARAEDLPLIVLSIEHDGPGPSLQKRRTRQGRSTGEN
jgi:hypothetical protein